MNNYIRLSYLEIIFILIIYFFSGSIISYLFQNIGDSLHINSYIFSPFSILMNYLFIFLFYKFIVFSSKHEKFIINYSVQRFSLFPIALLLFIGQSIIAEFLTGLIPTEGKYFGNLYHSMENALLGNLTQYPIITFLNICIIAPICEEIFFRGLILKGLLNYKVHPTKAIIISAFIFGGVHIFPWQMLGGIMAGIVLGIVFYKTGSLLTSTILHIINNLTGYIMYIKYKHLNTPDFFLSYDTFILCFGIVLLILFGYLYSRLTKNYIWNPY